jgi:ketosteroid isomerase-like protein
MMTSLIETFYKAFSNLDADRMIDCYHKDVEFKDPAFGILKGERAKAMWVMLCESQKGKDFNIEYSNILGSQLQGTAQWDAFYTFSKTGRKVHNRINAEFTFKDRRIIKHHDHFNMIKWAGQAFGLKGYLLGGTPFFKKRLQQQTNALLDKYIENHS